MPIIQIQEAKYMGNHSVWVRFNMGEEGIADLSDLIEHYKAAAPLRDPAVFAAFKLDDWPTLVWDCGFDVSPETLYERATGKAVAWSVSGIHSESNA